MAAIVITTGASLVQVLSYAVVSLIIGGAAKKTGDAIKNKGGGGGGDGGGEPPTPEQMKNDVFEKFDYARIKPIPDNDPTWLRLKLPTPNIL
jgi:hypothetical protein